MKGYGRPRVCFVAGTLDRGGAERQLYYQLRFLVQRGICVEVIALSSGEYWEKPISELGVPVKSLAWTGSRTLRLLSLTCHVLRTRPACIQSAHFYTNLYVAAAGRLTGTRDHGVVQSDVVRDIEANGVFGLPSLRIPRLLLLNSQRSMTTARRLGVAPDRLRLLPNVVDTERFHPAMARASGPFTVACVGRLVEEKRFDRLLSVVARVRARLGASFRVLIAGDGPERQPLEQRARDMALDSSTLVFLGAQDEPEQVYRSADAFLFVSDHEGSPNVVLEAMASGLPVVAEAVNGIHELVSDNETGLITSRFDEDETASRVVQLAGDPSLRRRIGENARLWVERERSFERLETYLTPLYGLTDGARQM